MFSYTISVHVMMSLIPVIRYRLQHMYSIYFSAHCDCEWDEGLFTVFAGALVRSKKLRRLKLARGLATHVHQGVLIAKSLLRDLGSAVLCILTKWQIR